MSWRESNDRDYRTGQGGFTSKRPPPVSQRSWRDTVRWWSSVVGFGAALLITVQFVWQSQDVGKDFSEERLKYEERLAQLQREVSIVAARADNAENSANAREFERLAQLEAISAVLSTHCAQANNSPKSHASAWKLCRDLSALELKALNFD